MNTEERWRLYERKAMFTECLGALMRAEPSIGVRDLTYRADEASGAETVEILFEGGLIRKADVTADSFLAIMEDVLKVVRKYG